MDATDDQLLLKFRSELVDYACLKVNSEMPRGAGTELLTKFICRWARREKLSCVREVHLGAFRQAEDDSYRRRGLVDFVLGSRFAIEVDSSNKRWSLTKLEYAAALGYVAVWIRWHSPNCIAVPPSVRLISLPISNSVKAARYEAYLSEVSAAAPARATRPLDAGQQNPIGSRTGVSMTSVEEIAVARLRRDITKYAEHQVSNNTPRTKVRTFSSGRSRGGQPSNSSRIRGMCA